MAPETAAPAGYRTIQPYLIVNNGLAAIDFYQRAFGATERMCMKEGSGRVAHAELLFGDGCVMLADEHPSIDAFSPAHYGGSPARLMLYVADCDATYRQAIDSGATSVREPADQPYGDRSAGVLDPFGYTWYLATQLREMSREELEALTLRPAAETSPA